MEIGKKFYIVTISVFVILMAFLAIGDLDYTISSAIINEDSLWARFFDIIGEFPAMLAIIVGVTLLYGGRRRDVTWWNVVSTILAVIFIGLFSYMAVFNPIRYIFHEDMDAITSFAKVVNIILSLAIAVAALYIAHTKGEKFIEFKKHAWLLIVLVIGEMVLVNVVKILWARPRMRSITDVSEFKHWYEIAGPTGDNELKSFPSGHTANAWIGLAYIIFSQQIKMIKVNHFIIGAVIWGTLVALSRVVLGAHFLSDVLVGSYITIFLFILLERIFIKHKVHKN